MRWGLLLAVSLSAVPAQAADTERSRFVQEYVHEIASFEDLRLQAADQTSSAANQRMVDCVRNMERFRLEIGTYTSAIGQFKLPKEYDQLPGIIKALWQNKAELYGQMGSGCEKFLTQKPGVDYAKLAGEIPKVTAQLEFYDHQIFKVSPLVALVLADEKRQVSGKTMYFVIDMQQRRDLLSTINGIKGVNAKNPNYLVGAAAMVKHFLLMKGYKALDER